VTPAVFLDRDGTIIEEVGYLDRLDRIRFFPWTVDAIRVLNQAGFLVVVVTNQAGVARGYFDETLVRDTHAQIDKKVREGGARIDAYYYCPHHPDATVAAYRAACECRKPKPGMIHRAARELGIDLGRSVVVGDRWLDVRRGRAAGGATVVVRTGYGLEEEGQPDGTVADAVADNLMGASAWIIRRRAAGAATPSRSGF
jgi:D-glycero-D-manno-heptose 1,7-bisphosphate phosphatase